MKYDFTSVPDRKGKDALCVDMLGKEGFPGAPQDAFSPIPMWVADMNFKCAPSIADAIKKRLEHPLFGYFPLPDEYFSSIISWQEKRHGVKGLTARCIGYENGVLGGVVSAANILCSKGGNILINSPTYIGFTGALENNGYKLILSPLMKDEKNIWRMDFKDMEEKILKHKIHCAVFCSPHNPTGRVWEEDEIKEAMELFKKHDVYVISDEIWSDIVSKGHEHIPTQSISDDAKNRTIAFYAPSKTFSLAGLVGSYRVIYNKTLRDRYEKETSLSHYNSANVLSVHALIGAYCKEGAEWADEMNEVITDNINTACRFFEKYAGEISFSKPEGTYMLFIDCEEWCKKHGKTVDSLLKSAWDKGVIWQDVRPFHGEYSIRLNLALPKTMLEEALSRLEKYVLC